MRKGSVTVVISSFKYGNYLPVAIDSVLRQTKLPDQILLTDDHSCDDTKEIMQKYISKFPKLISMYRNEHNLGMAKNFNKALSMVDTEYVCFLDADDLYMPQFIELTKKLLDSNEHHAIAYTDMELIGTRAESIFWEWEEKNRLIGPNGELYLVFPEFTASSKQILQKYNFMHSASLFRVEAAREVGGYLKEEGFPLDHALFRRMVNKGWGAGHINKPLLQYRQHSVVQMNAALLLKSNEMMRLELETKSKEQLINEHVFLESKIVQLLKEIQIMRETKGYKLTQGLKKLQTLLHI